MEREREIKGNIADEPIGRWDLDADFAGNEEEKSPPPFYWLWRIWSKILGIWGVVNLCLYIYFPLLSKKKLRYIYIEFVSPRVSSPAIETYKGSIAHLDKKFRWKPFRSCLSPFYLYDRKKKSSLKNVGRGRMSWLSRFYIGMLNWRDGKSLIGSIPPQLHTRSLR